MKLLIPFLLFIALYLVLDYGAEHLDDENVLNGETL